MSEHTPTPWRVKLPGAIVADEDTGWDDPVNLDGYEGHLVCESIRWQANAEFIVRACNAHDDLMDGLRQALGTFQLLGSGQKPPLSCAEMCDLIGGIIDKAEGGR